MKTIDYYMGLPYKLEIVPDVEEGGYVARYPELPGCISVGSTLEETVNHVLDAKKEWLIAALEDGIVINEPVAHEMSRLPTITIQGSSSSEYQKASTAPLQSILRRKGSV